MQMTFKLFFSFLFCFVLLFVLGCVKQRPEEFVGTSWIGHQESRSTPQLPAFMGQSSFQREKPHIDSH